MTYWHDNHSHPTEEEYERCAASDRSGRRWAIVALVVLAVLVLGGMAAWNEYVYGDWTCAFAHCRKVILEKQP